MNSEKRKIVLLIATVVIISILAFIFAYNQLFGKKVDSPIENQYATFPENNSDVVLDIAPIDDTIDVPAEPAEVPVYTEEEVVESRETNWRDEIVQASATNAETSNTAYNKQTEINTFSAQAELDALYAASDSLSQLVRNITKSSPLPNNVPNDPMSFSDYSALFDLPKINNSSLLDCGKVNVPSNESDLSKFTSNFYRNSTAICAGKAIASNCAATKIVVSEIEDYDQTVYILKNTEGKCAMGSAYGDSKSVTLCNIDQVMDSLLGDDKESLTWQLEFAKNPGTTFSSLYFGFSDGLTKSVSTNNLTCQNFELN